MTIPRTVTVVGAGVVGLCCAYSLTEAGIHVTLVERDRVGSGASRGNAGEICPDLVDPLPAPGVIGPALRTMHRPDAALHIHPRPSADLVRFLLGFARHANRRAHRAGTTALVDLAAGTFDRLGELESIGVDLRANRGGFLYVFGSEDSARRALNETRALGAPVSADGLLDSAALAERHDALTPRARAGFEVDGQWAIDPNRYVDTLADALRARGVEIVEGARATGIDSTQGRTLIRTTAGTIDADASVVAAGIWTRPLCRALGTDLNIFPGKGYSFTVPVESPPSQLLHLGDAHVAMNPLNKGVRVAGTMEFEADHDRFRPRRIEAIVAAAGPYVHGVDWARRSDEWVGPRPMTPTGLPAIGALPGASNVYVAAGHNMLGVMLSPSTGGLIRDLVTGAPTPAYADAFAPTRIARRTRG